MAVRIRLKRFGRKNRTFFRLGVFDSMTRRDGRAIEELGHYDPLVADDDKKYSLNRERISYWLSKGALPTPTVQNILLSQGVDVPTSGKKRAMSPEEKAAHVKVRAEKQVKRDVAMARKAKMVEATSKPMSKKERREAKKAGG
ncbi:MAG: 30S ribosomal protein S16 [Planctomycetota bacterium]|nr:30S ribosomal protein S16 [Planctomycetota bacterium]